MHSKWVHFSLLKTDVRLTYIQSIQSISWTCHTPTWEGVYGENFKVLKPRGIIHSNAFHFTCQLTDSNMQFGVYAWCMTDARDPFIPSHKELAHQVEFGNDIPERWTMEHAHQAIASVGFQLEHNEEQSQFHHPLQSPPPAASVPHHQTNNAIHLHWKSHIYHHLLHAICCHQRPHHYHIQCQTKTASKMLPFILLGCTSRTLTMQLKSQQALCRPSPNLMIPLVAFISFSVSKNLHSYMLYCQQPWGIIIKMFDFSLVL